MSLVKCDKTGFVVKPRYCYIGSLGAGVASTVACFSDTIKKQNVAIKRSSIKTGNPNQAFRELAFLRMCNHKHIIKLLDAWRDDTSLYFAQEMGTCNLQEYLEGNPIQSMDEVARLSAQIFSGVNHIHKLQIIHADLKYGNVVIAGPKNDAKLIDFDRLIPASEAAKNKSPYRGTVGYEAPELIMGGAFDFKADCWSVGVIIAEMIIADSYLFEAEPGQPLLDLYHQTLKTPSEKYLKSINVDFYDAYFKDKTYPGKSWAEILDEKIVMKSCTKDEKIAFYDLLSSLITFDPIERLSMSDAMKHKFVAKFCEEEEEDASKSRQYDPTIEKQLLNDWRQAFDSELEYFNE
uniref:Protein kinase domain-containing protein n=1 Tax=Panagrolaimus sp. PS1159 TaxID=55785 RepID=A0AC35EZB1_9BILA